MYITAPPSDQMTPGLTPGRGSGPRRLRPMWLVLVAVSLPMFMATLDNLVMTSALPVIDVDLQPSVEQLQWFMNAYTLAFAALMLPAASLGDRFGRRRVFVAGIVLFALASTACALATSPETLIAARAVQGVGSAAITPLSLTLLAAAVPPAKRALAIGVWGGVSGLGIALGPLVGGAVVEGLNWQAIFWLNAPVAIIAVPIALLTLGESFGRPHRIDLLGLALATGGVVLGVWGVVDADDAGWTSARTIAMLTASVALLAAFVFSQTRVRSPLMPLRLFRSPAFSAANAAGVTFSMGMFGAVFLLTQYLQVSLGYSPLEAGVRTLPWTAAPMIIAPIAGALTHRVGSRALMTTGTGLLAVSLTWIAIVINADASAYASIIPALALAGIGTGLSFSPLSTAVLHGLAEDDHGIASSVSSTLREVGVALGIAVLTATFLASNGAFTPAAYATGLVPALAVGAGLSGVATLAALAIPGRVGRAEPVSSTD